MKLEWTTEKRKVSDLIPYEKNPRYLSDEQREKLTASIEKFNLVDIPVIDADGVLVSGHQRVKVLVALGRGDELVDVRVPNRKLTEEEFKELNIRSNINNGDWLADILREDFLDLDFEELGFSESEVEGLGLNEPSEIEGNFEDDSISYKEQYGVIVICGGEAEQEKIFSELTSSGYTCKIVVT